LTLSNAFTYQNYYNTRMTFWIIGTVVLSLISPISYTRSMLAGKSKPHRVTRLIVWLASVAGVLGILGSDNLAGQIFAGIFLARASFLLFMAFKYGVGGTTKLDLTCLIFGVLALLAYATTKNGLLTISLGILADVIGYVPTFVKTYRQPDSEDPLFFGIEGLASLFGVFAVWQLRADILFPIYFTLCSALMLGLIYRKKTWSRT
jgi:hypothetical protein